MIEHGDIAIVGMSCRMPMAPDPDALWQLLRDGVDAVTHLPATRSVSWRTEDSVRGGSR
jgi:acyl transferase domain-containing protein